jgi:hypothetical protein
MQTHTCRLSLMVMVVGWTLACSDEPADNVIASAFARDGVTYWLTDMAAWASPIDDRLLRQVEDSLVNEVLGRFNDNEREVLRSFLLSEGGGSIAGIQGDPIAAELVSKVVAVRRRIRLLEVNSPSSDHVIESPAWLSDTSVNQTTARMRALYEAGLIPIGVVLAPDFNAGNGVAILRRTSEAPNDILVLSGDPTLSEFKTGLAAVLSLHGNVGACPTEEGIVRVRGRTRMPAGSWGTQDDRRAADTVQSLKGGQFVDLPSLGRVRMRTIWIRRFYNVSEGPPREVDSTTGVCGI